jgi:hypothetical protein
VRFLACVAALLVPILSGHADEAAFRRLEAELKSGVQPLLKEFCLTCHSTAKHKGDLDLERFKSVNDLRRDTKVWEKVIEQIALGEMPPKEKPQPSARQLEQLTRWVRAVLDAEAIVRAGDPGRVVLRRLSNAEFTHTVRDLTGVISLAPAREFPADGAAGEGFMNVGSSLVMSPSLVTKYLDAAKEIAAHAVLLPAGIGFSASTSQRDWAEERLTAIRAFYRRYTEPGGGTAVNLQGIKFDTKDGGVLPLEKYLAATLAERGALAGNSKEIADVARVHGLNAKYLAALWAVLNDPKPSLVLDPIREQWRGAKPADAPALAAGIAQWQRALWRFTTVGHIGKRDGPKAWQVPVQPLAATREVRLKLPAATAAGVITFYLAASDAGDGNANDFAVWENPRLIIPGHPDLRLRDVRGAAASLEIRRAALAAGTAACLAAAAEAGALPDQAALTTLARRHNAEPALLAAWLDYLGVGGGPVRVDSHLTVKGQSVRGYDFVKSWTGKEVSVVANSSDRHVRIPGNLKPQSIAVHPSPKLRILIGWQSPVAARLRIEGVVQHAHPECGNGVEWRLELRRGNTRQRLASGTAQGAREVKFGPLEKIAVEPGDLLSIGIGPRDGDHSCDLTTVDLGLKSEAGQEWNLARDLSPDILAGNPHADRLGNGGVWHFYSEPDNGAGVTAAIPANSLLAKWRGTADVVEKRLFAAAIQKLLQTGPSGLAKDSPDALLHRQLTAANGPLLAGGRGQAASNEVRNMPPEIQNPFGLDPALFGRHPNGTPLPLANLCVRAPSLLEVRLPADLAEGAEFVATATLHRETGAEGSVQMQAQPARPGNVSGLVAGTVREQGGKRTWTDGGRPVASDAPILVADGSAARRRIEAAFEEFRQIFPAALCYTKLVPADEVVTLTLHYREDEPLRRLMLDAAQAAELERLWSELRFVSHEPLKLVDAFEQLWQFATQDADPSAFTPMREPIQQRAAAFRQELAAAEPRHLEAVLSFAARAWRRPVTEAEQGDLHALYRKLRARGLGHDAALRMTLSRVFVAPAFLYKLETPGPGTKAADVTDLELASRLSYFLWSSLPDAELMQAATAGRLREPAVLAGQARRMLADARARRLAVEFGCAWLHLHGFDELDEKSERHFPSFAKLRGAMYEETILFLTDLFQNDGSVLSLLNADHAFLNGPLAAHYGIAGVTGSDWRRVEGVGRFGRGGILFQAGMLSKQSGASRTSPILRGNWVAEVLLGEKLPRPPKEVPRLPEDEAAETLTVRQIVERHTRDARCAGCHARIDPYGFALERFDAIGRARERDLGGRMIDDRTTLADGTAIAGPAGLRDHLVNARRAAFLKQFCRKLLGFALGREVQLSDELLLAEMQARLAEREHRVSAAVEVIVQSRQFRQIRGREAAAED